MAGMFNNATEFSQDLSGWNVDNVYGVTGFEYGSKLTEDQLPKWKRY